MEMSREDDALSRELDIYIRKHLHSEGITLKDFLNLGGQYATGSNSSGAKWALEFLLKNLELTFSEKLVELIEEKGRKPSEIYTKAGITKTHFSKIRSDKDYHPTKETALAFAVVLHLSLEDTEELIGRAGFTLSNSSKRDLIVKCFIERGIYDVDEINYNLDKRGLGTLTNRRNSA